MGASWSQAADFSRLGSPHGELNASIATTTDVHHAVQADTQSQRLGDWAIANASVLVNADYRLMPEATGVDILADISDLWKWIRHDLPSLLSPLSIEADLTRIITVGESAGGYLAVQAALLHPEMDVKAVISQYGVLDIRTPHYTQAYEKSMMGAPSVSRALLDDHIGKLRGGQLPKTISSATPPARMDLTLVGLPASMSC